MTRVSKNQKGAICVVSDSITGDVTYGFMPQTKKAKKKAPTKSQVKEKRGQLKNILERIDEAFASKNHTWGIVECRPDKWRFLQSVSWGGGVSYFKTLELEAKTLPALLKKIEREIKKREKK